MGQQVSLLAQLLPEPSPIRPYVHPGQYRCIPNVRHYSDGMSKTYFPNLATTLISAVTLAAYISIPHMMLGLFLAAFFSRTALALLAVLMATLLLPAKPLRVPSVLSSYLFLCWRRYFKFSYLFEVSLDSYQDYIVAQFPHGAFPLGALLGGTFMATEWPEYPCYALAANAAFWVPIWRHVHSWLGTEACTKTNFHRLLAKGVKGPLPPHRHHHHHHHSGKQQQQEGEGEKAGAEGVQPQQQQQQQRAKSVGGTPFNCTAVAAAAAAGGVTAVGPAGVAAAAAAAEVSPVLGTFASAAVLPPRSSLTPNELTGGAGYRGWSPLGRRTSSAPLGRRLSAALSLPTSVFRAGHTLSDTESSESDASSSSSSGDGLEDEDGGCSCGSGLSCKTPGRCAAARRSSSSGAVHGGRSSGSGRDGGSMDVGLGVAIVRAYGVSDSGSSCSSRSSSSSGGASCCGCCGACSVLAEVHSLPLDPFARKQQQLLQQQHSLVTIPSDEMEGTAAVAPTAAAADAAVECDDDSGCRLPLLGQQQQQQQHYQQQRLVFRRLSSPAAAAPAGDKQQQQVLSQLSQQSSQQQQQQQQSHSSNYQIDPATGERKLGVSVGLMVGGIAEMFMIRKDHERIKLKDRKGFVRIAVEHGVDLIPCYMFGVNQCLDFGPPWLQRLSRRLRASLGVIYGVWGLPIPRRVPIFKVTGKPLVVGPPMRKDHPDFAARVDELHALFCVEIERLYYAHREKYGHGFENKPLVIC